MTSRLRKKQQTIVPNTLAANPAERGMAGPEPRWTILVSALGLLIATGSIAVAQQPTASLSNARDWRARSTTKPVVRDQWRSKDDRQASWGHVSMFSRIRQTAVRSRLGWIRTGLSTSLSTRIERYSRTTLELEATIELEALNVNAVFTIVDGG